MDRQAIAVELELTDLGAWPDCKLDGGRVWDSLWLGASEPVRDDCEDRHEGSRQKKAQYDHHPLEDTHIERVLSAWLAGRNVTRNRTFIRVSHMDASRVLTLTAGAADAGHRLDRVLSRNFGEVSRARFQSLIADGRVRLDGKTIVEARHRVKPGARIEVVVPEPSPTQPLPQAMPLSVVYEDDDVIVIDKPAGLVVHPAPGHWEGTLVNALLAHCGESLSGIGGERRPGIVHRLDRHTSGLMVIAKNDRAHRSLSEQFAAHGRDGRLERAYQAIVWGRPGRLSGTVSAAIGRKPSNRQKMAVRPARGRAAVTHYRVIKTFDQPGSPTLIECRLETGRTHQIRVHMAHAGHPLLGDHVYGKSHAASASRLPAAARAALARLGGQALHAAVLGFEHPVSRQALRFSTPPPADFKHLEQVLS
jgi:23S rRNA pseudouridine1911/1915/1917 synthase